MPTWGQSPDPPAGRSSGPQTGPAGAPTPTLARRRPGLTSSVTEKTDSAAEETRIRYKQRGREKRLWISNTPPVGKNNHHLFSVSRVTESLMDSSGSLRHRASVPSLPMRPWAGGQERACVVRRSRAPGVRRSWRSFRSTLDFQVKKLRPGEAERLVHSCTGSQGLSRDGITVPAPRGPSHACGPHLPGEGPSRWGSPHTALTLHSEAGHALFPRDSVTSERWTGRGPHASDPSCPGRWEHDRPRTTEDTGNGPRSHRSHGAGLGHVQARFLFRPVSCSEGQGQGGLTVTRGSP